MKKNYYGLDRSNFKIRISRQNVSVDEKNKRVIANLDWELDAPNAFSDVLFGLGDFGFIRGSAKGVAVCVDGDVFDAVKGEKVAIAIAENNAYTNASNIVAKRVAHLNDMMDKITEMRAQFGNKAVKVVEHNKEYIKRITE